VIPPYPRSPYLSLLLPDEIAEAAEIYLYAVSIFLQLDKDAFILASDISTQPGTEMVNFLAQYVNERASNAPSLSPELDDKVFNLIFRFVSEGRDISAWVDWVFVAGLTCGWYEGHRQSELAPLLTRLWRRARTKIDHEFVQLRDYYIQAFESIVMDEANDIVPTMTGLRYMVTLNNDIVDVLVDDDGEFLMALHSHYGAYRGHLNDLEKKAMMYLFYTIIVSLAYRASEASVGQNKKGKGTVGSAETLFFDIFEKLFTEYVRGRYDALIEDVTHLTPFVEIMAEWIEGWKGADEAVETLMLYLERLKIEEPSEEVPASYTDGNVRPVRRCQADLGVGS
jgi:hypothetical protein